MAKSKSKTKRDRVSCRHCREAIPYEMECSRCQVKYQADGRCADYHDEVVHGTVKDQNIHQCGGQRGGLDGIDQDADAFGKNYD